ncbi:tetratricopeptide repeat protein [Legionella yabuuchiae]|uniref:tetratricopeptide repeat protein n=1 Tax=Legionella yabuuchiae TaxID=376727 RepID=UPI001054F904|nr:tetratricopeptide repeat protein [Legionella yabuuchiae]
MKQTAHRIILLLLIMWSQHVMAWSWRDLWVTKNQQGQRLMNQGHYNEAEATFERTDWQAAAAYRAGNYSRAADLYQSQNDVQGYYNRGNALAHMGDYEDAIAAYDKALAIEPDHQDALHNRKVIADLLKKDKERQDNQQQNQSSQDQQQQDQSKQNQNKQGQDKQSQDKQSQDKQGQDKQGQDKQSQDKQGQDKQGQDKQGQDKQGQDKQGQDKQGQDKQGQDKQEQGKQDQDKTDRDQPGQDKSSQSKAQTQKTDGHTGKKAAADSAQPDSEQEQAKEQLLRLVPDDPGGLMREKFLRDHLRRQRGWD